MNKLQSKVLLLNVKELQECLSRLGLSKQGKKAELQQRLLGSVGDIMKGKQSMESVYQMLDTVLSKRPERGRAPSSSYQLNAGPSASDSALRELIENMLGPSAVPGAGPSSSPGAAQRAGGAAPSVIGKTNAAVRCICGVYKDDCQAMVQCEDDSCGFWQHCACIGITTREQEERPHYCEYCRLRRADPFWEGLDTGILRPTPLQAANGAKLPVAGQANSVPMVVERAFHVTQDHLRYRYQGSAVKLQLACLQLMDANPFRVHWPLHSEVRVNQASMRPYMRNGPTKLGANQRDEALDIFPAVLLGPNRVRLQCSDAYQYVVLLQLARRRSTAEVRALIQPAQSLEDALTRVVRTLKGGEGEEDEDCVVENTVLSLRCPLTGSRITVPARFTEVPGIACFDLEPFLAMAERTRKWQCPHSMRNSSIQTLQVDAFVQRILDNLRTHEEVTEVEISPEGRWRPAGSSSRWFHIGDGYEPPSAQQQQQQRQPGVKQEAGARAGGGGSDEESED